MGKNQLVRELPYRGLGRSPGRCRSVHFSINWSYIYLYTYGATDVITAIAWMSSNRLKLNASKTEFIWIGILDGSSPRSRKKPWSVGNQSRRWWRYGISVSSSTGSWQWRLMWAILYVAACINSANFAASSGRWPSTAGVHLPQHLLVVVSTTAMVSYTVSRKEKFSDFKGFWTLLRDSSLVRGSSDTSPLSSVMSSTGSLYSTKSATKSPY